MTKKRGTDRWKMREIGQRMREIIGEKCGGNGKKRNRGNWFWKNAEKWLERKKHAANKWIKKVKECAEKIGEKRRGRQIGEGISHRFKRWEKRDWSTDGAAEVIGGTEKGVEKCPNRRKLRPNSEKGRGGRKWSKWSTKRGGGDERVAKSAKPKREGTTKFGDRRGWVLTSQSIKSFHFALHFVSVTQIRDEKCIWMERGEILDHFRWREGKDWKDYCSDQRAEEIAENPKWSSGQRKWSMEYDQKG